MFKSTGTTSNATTYLDIMDRLFDKQNNNLASYINVSSCFYFFYKRI